MAQPRKKHRRVADEPASEVPSTRFLSAPSTTVGAEEASQLPLQSERASIFHGSTPEKQPEVYIWISLQTLCKPDKDCDV